MLHFIDGINYIITNGYGVIIVEIKLHISDFQVGKVDDIVDQF